MGGSPNGLPPSAFLPAQSMTKKRWWLVIGAAVVAAAATGIALDLTLGGGGTMQLTHDDFLQLWEGTHLGDAKQVVLSRWPDPPYQHYADNLKDDCYEWEDVPDVHNKNLPTSLYNLCFKDGILRSKVIG